MCQSIPSVTPSLPSPSHPILFSADTDELLTHWCCSLSLRPLLRAFCAATLCPFSSCIQSGETAQHRIVLLCFFLRTLCSTATDSRAALLTSLPIQSDIPLSSCLHLSCLARPSTLDFSWSALQSYSLLLLVAVD